MSMNTLPPAPDDILGALRLILGNLSDAIKHEGIPIIQGNLKLTKLTFEYPGMAGKIEVIIGKQTDGR